MWTGGAGSRTLLALVAVVATACAPQQGSGAADKAGGSKPPVILRLADSNNTGQPDTPTIEHFASTLSRLTHGTVRVRITYLAAGSTAANVEVQTIRLVKQKHYDLGWIGARVWDEIGVTSFQALQAPFLIDSRNLLDRVVESPMAAAMLDGLRSRGFVGLALAPDDLRHPIGISHALVSLADYDGARIRIQPSRASVSLFEALGARPVGIANAQIGYALTQHAVDGEELPLRNTPGHVTATVNVAFFGKALTLFTRPDVLDRLTPSQRQAVAQAAADTVHYAVTTATIPDAYVLQHYCFDGRRAVLATPRQRLALVRATQPAYAALSRDPATRRYIATIRAWKRSTPPDPAIHLPASCSSPDTTPKPTATLRDPSTLNGTYRWVITAKDAHAADPTQPHPGDVYPMIGIAVLQDGRWRFPQSSITSDDDRGTYTIRGNWIRFVWPRVASILNFHFTLGHDGVLHLKPILPMDPGDQFVWASQPWHRVGPPSLGH